MQLPTPACPTQVLLQRTQTIQPDPLSLSLLVSPPLCGYADAQALSRNLAPGKLAIGQSVTRGLGAGGVPSVGRKAAEESMDDLSEFPGVSRAVRVRSTCEMSSQGKKLLE